MESGDELGFSPCEEGVIRTARSLGVFLFVAGLTSAGCGGGEGTTSPTVTVPANDVAVVDDDAVDVPGLFEDGVMSKTNFNRFLLQTAKQNKLQQIPQASDPQYEQLKDNAMQSALQIGWIVGEANRHGLSFTDQQVAQSLGQIKSQFKSQHAYEQARDQAGLTEADLLLRARLQLIQNAIQDKIKNSASGTGSAAQQAAAQQAALTRFGQTFRETWQRRTTCAPEYVATGCANGPPATSTTAPTSP